MRLKEVLTLYLSEIKECPWSHAPHVSIRLKDSTRVFSGFADEVSNMIENFTPGLLKKNVSDFYDDEVSLHFTIILDCYAI